MVKFVIIFVKVKTLFWLRCKVHRGVRSGLWVLRLDTRYNSHSISISNLRPQHPGHMCVSHPRCRQMQRPVAAAAPAPAPGFPPRTHPRNQPLVRGPGAGGCCSTDAVNKTFIKILYTQHVPRLAGVPHTRHGCFPRRSPDSRGLTLFVCVFGCRHRFWMFFEKSQLINFAHSSKLQERFSADGEVLLPFGFWGSVFCVLLAWDSVAPGGQMWVHLGELCLKIANVFKMR